MLSFVGVALRPATGRGEAFCGLLRPYEWIRNHSAGVSIIPLACRVRRYLCGLT